MLQAMSANFCLQHLSVTLTINLETACTIYIIVEYCMFDSILARIVEILFPFLATLVAYIRCAPGYLGLLAYMMSSVGLAC
jgi:hypothetical protein